MRYARYSKITDHIDDLRHDMTFEFFNIGDQVVSEENVHRVAQYAQSRNIDTIVGIGGGKGQDFARALTHFLPLKVILVPTVVATNASISTLSVLYDSDGESISQYWRMDNAPDLVLADTALLLENGPQVLGAGIGDITSTYYEALCNLKMTGRFDILPTLSYQSIELAVDIMRKQVPAAMQAIREKKSNPAFESVVSLILHNNGPMGMICTLGFAHALDEVCLHFEAAHKIPHGLRVGFLTIPMLLFVHAAENEIRQYLDLCKEAGIPTSLKELWLEQIDKAQWREAFHDTVEKSGTMASLPFRLTPTEMIESLFQAGNLD